MGAVEAKAASAELGIGAAAGGSGSAAVRAPAAREGAARPESRSSQYVASPSSAEVSGADIQGMPPHQSALEVDPPCLPEHEEALFEPLGPIPVGEEAQAVPIGDVLGYEALEDLAPEPHSAGAPRDLASALAQAQHEEDARAAEVALVALPELIRRTLGPEGSAHAAGGGKASLLA